MINKKIRQLSMVVIILDFAVLAFLFLLLISFFPGQQSNDE